MAHIGFHAHLSPEELDEFYYALPEHQRTAIFPEGPPPEPKAKKPKKAVPGPDEDTVDGPPPATKKPDQLFARGGARRYESHPEAHAFLRAMAENPKDDAPRLVFADWLDEHDKPNIAHMMRHPQPSPDPPIGKDDPDVFHHGEGIGSFAAEDWGHGPKPYYWFSIHGHGSRDEWGDDDRRQKPVPNIMFHMNQWKTGPGAVKVFRHYETDPAKALAIIREMGKVTPHEVDPQFQRQVRQHRATPEEMIRDVFGVEPEKFQRQAPPRRYADDLTHSFSSALRALSSPNVRAFSEAIESSYKRAGIHDGRAVPVIHDTPRTSLPALLGLIRGPVDPKKALYAAAWHGLMAKQDGTLAFLRGPGEDSVYSIKFPMPAGDVRGVLDRIGVQNRLIRPVGHETEAIVHDPGRRFREHIASLGVPVREMTGKGVLLRGREDYRNLSREVEGENAPAATA